MTQTCRDKLSVLSVADNQIVTLSARSPYNTLSGCTISKKAPPKIPIFFHRPTDLPVDTTNANDETKNLSTETSFDKYLKITTTTKSSIKELDDPMEKSFDENSNNTFEGSASNEFLDSFNDTEVFNASAMSGDRKLHNDGGLLFKHDTVLENQLENSTEYKLDVEELFESHQARNNQIANFNDDDDIDDNRQRRSGDLTFRRSKETYIVRCHNAGTFISSRERWYLNEFILILNQKNN